MMLLFTNLSPIKKPEYTLNDFLCRQNRFTLER